MKQKIYIDIDDVLINTSEVVIELLNLTYDLNPPKTIYDLKDWEYRSIYRYRDYNLIERFWETEDFFYQVQISPQFIELYQQTKDKVEWIFFTTGTEKNLELKRKYFSKWYPENEIITIPLYTNKHTYDLSDGIQIDDKYSNLCSNAQLKILLTNEHEADYNKVLYSHDDLYVCDNWDQLKEMLIFLIENPKYIKN